MNTTPYHTVMIVDDSEIDRYIAERVIRKSNFAEHVVSAECALDALQYIEQHIAQPGKLPQVIFLDINMPDLNGFDFLERYEAFPAEVKKKCIILMLTSSLDAHDQALAGSNPHIARFLNKPLSPEKLEELEIGPEENSGG